MKKEPRLSHSCMGPVKASPDESVLPARKETSQGARRGETEELATDPDAAARKHISDFGIWLLFLPNMFVSTAVKCVFCRRTKLV